MNLSPRSLFLACLLTLFPLQALAEPAADTETRITADELTYSAEKQRVVFSKNVYVHRPDFELWADKLTVHLKPPKASKPAANETSKKGQLPDGMVTGDVDRIVAENNVRMKREGRSGSCSKATYVMDKEMLIMEGDPRLSDGENTITGGVIRYYTKENRSEVLSEGKKRVEAVFSGTNKTKSPLGDRRP